MAFVVADRVKETTTTVGTGAVALAGAVIGFRTFGSGVGNSNTTYYAIVSQTANEWEVGYGTLDATSANLARTTVFSSSSGGTLVSFSAGTKDVFVTQPATRTLVQTNAGATTNGVFYYNGSGIAATGAALTFDGTDFATTGTSTGVSFIPTGSAVPANGMYLPAANTIGFSTNSAVRAYINASGNFGLAQLPNAWGTNYSSFDVKTAGSLSGSLTAAPIVSLSTNAYNDNTNWLYKAVASTAATNYSQTGGYHYWYNAAAGTAGNTVTFNQAMTLTPTNNLLIGTATDGKRLTVSDTAESTATFIRANNTVGNEGLIDFQMQNSSNAAVIYAQIGSSINANTAGAVNGSFVINTANASVVTEKARVDNAGNLQMQAGGVMPYAPAPASLNTTSTLTNANIQAQLINTTGTSYTVTMPLGSTLDTLADWSTTNIAYDFVIINTASGTITMAVNTGVTSLGSLSITTGTSARYRIRRTAASTYVLYRL
jgi:hypothetical protein